MSLIAVALSPSLSALGFALFALGLFAAIYHPVGTAMIVEAATQRGRTLAFNGVCGNLGVSLAAGITAALTALVVLARRVLRAGRDLHRDRFRLSVVRAQGKPPRGVALEVA